MKQAWRCVSHIAFDTRHILNYTCRAHPHVVLVVETPKNKRTGNFGKSKRYYMTYYHAKRWFKTLREADAFVRRWNKRAKEEK